MGVNDDVVHHVDALGLGVADRATSIGAAASTTRGTA